MNEKLIKEIIEGIGRNDYKDGENNWIVDLEKLAEFLATLEARMERIWLKCEGQP